MKTIQIWFGSEEHYPMVLIRKQGQEEGKYYCRVTEASRKRLASLAWHWPRKAVFSDGWAAENA